MTPTRTPLAEIIRLFLRLGFTAFGGPAAHISMMHDEVVTRRQWMTDQHFLDLVGRCELGQLAALGLGERRHRRDLHPGAGNRAQQEGAQRMQRRRAAVARQQGLNVLIGRCAAARRGFG